MRVLTQLNNTEIADVQERRPRRPGNSIIGTGFYSRNMRKGSNGEQLSEHFAGKSLQSKLQLFTR
jgi:hypothetical protein